MTSTILSLILLFSTSFNQASFTIDGLDFITVKINGQDACLLIDSEFPVTVLDSRKAAEFGYKAVGPEYAIQGLCNNDTWRAASEATIKINDKHIFPTLATANLVCLQDQFSETLPAPLVGILGRDNHSDFQKQSDSMKYELTTRD
ncbi:MAG: hypothetical protein AB8F95_12395 [Bacteroidia bacterium]